MSNLIDNFKRRINSKPLDLKPKDHPDYFKVGTILTRYLHSFGIYQTKDCSCDRYEDLYNRWGADGCRKRIDSIVRQLKGTAILQGRLFNAFIAKQLVLHCCNIAKKHEQNPT